MSSLKLYLAFLKYKLNDDMFYLTSKMSPELIDNEVNTTFDESYSMK